jgi:tripartite-type tricarboxylate transporter receptor subunit TctC
VSHYRAAIAIAAMALVSSQAPARGAPGPVSFPAKPVRLVVPTAPGGGVDTSARILAQKLTEAWGQQVIVDNRGGGSGVIGTEIVARAPADGHTLLIAPTTFSTTRSLVKKLAYDPVRDFTPISLISREPNVLMVHPGVSAGSVQELVASIRARPDALNFSAGGVGSTAALCGELFKLRTGTRAAVLSYKGAGPAVNALVAGEVQAMFIGLPPTLPLLKADKLRALAVTARERSSFLPAVPTMAQAGVRDFEVSNWIGVLAPAATANGVVRQINEDMRRVLESAVVRERFKLHGVVPEPGSPDEFARFLRGEIERWEQVIKAAKITLD